MYIRDKMNSEHHLEHWLWPSRDSSDPMIHGSQVPTPVRGLPRASCQAGQQALLQRGTLGQRLGWWLLLRL